MKKTKQNKTKTKTKTNKNKNQDQDQDQDKDKDCHPIQLNKTFLLFSCLLTETIRGKVVSYKRGLSWPKLDPKGGQKSNNSANQLEPLDQVALHALP